MTIIFVASTSGKSIDRSGRIVGGQEAPEGFAPWSALLRTEGQFYGSAVVISERFVSSRDAYCKHIQKKCYTSVSIGGLTACRKLWIWFG